MTSNLNLILAVALGVMGGLCALLAYWLRRSHDREREAQVRLAAAESRLATETLWTHETRKQMDDAFRSLAAQALESNHQQFLSLAKSALEKTAQEAQHDLANRQTAISHLVQPLEETLKKYGQQLQELERGRLSAFTTMELELKRVAETSSRLSQETRALKDALKRPHVRGRWGEVQLRNCVELAGMSEFADVTFQDLTMGNEEQRLIPDMTVRMPGGRLVIVDAKTPLDGFLQSLEATTDDERQAELLRHGRQTKEHVRRLAARSYAEHFKDSADFVVLFLPNESFLYAALEVEPDLMEFALERKVLMVTPPTFIGLLKVIRFGWNEQRLAENAQKISSVGQELHKRLCDFLEAYTAVGKALDRAREEYGTGLMRLDRRVLPQARRLEELGAKSLKSLPDHPDLLS